MLVQDGSQGNKGGFGAKLSLPQFKASSPWPWNSIHSFVLVGMCHYRMPLLLLRGLAFTVICKYSLSRTSTDDQCQINNSIRVKSHLSFEDIMHKMKFKQSLLYRIVVRVKLNYYEDYRKYFI